MSDWVFGVDGGGTNSRILVESLDGRTLYESGGGSTNLDANAAEEVSEVLERLLAGAFGHGLEPGGCKAGYIGSAGVDTEADALTMETLLRNAFTRAAARAGNTAGSLPVFGASNDAEPALVGALADTEGFLLIAGTGSIAYGRTHDGEKARAGGWGHFLGDEGSAFWLAFEGVKRGIRSSEGRDLASGLLDAALDHFGLPDAGSLLPFTYWRFDKARFASFAPRVTALASAGDRLAAAIVAQAAEELTALVRSVHAKLAPRLQRSRLALYGGLLSGNLALKTAVSELVTATIPAMELVEPLGNAQAGACRLARESLRLAR
ncbi:MAG: hypothetical protein JXM71_07215 [Spirochaetales bacterium]|nr:hypothetical protein [Spirochaetales bacterium]